MSDFRIFSIVSFVAIGLLCAASNRGLMEFDDRLGPLALGGIIGLASVALFGGRGR